MLMAALKPDHPWYMHHVEEIVGQHWYECRTCRRRATADRLIGLFGCIELAQCPVCSGVEGRRQLESRRIGERIETPNDPPTFRPVMSPERAHELRTQAERRDERPD